MKDDNAFAEAAKVAGAENYLGDYRRVEKWLREQGRIFLGALREGSAPIDAAMPVAKTIATVLLGKDPAWTPIPGWNEPGGIDESLAMAMESEETNPEEVLEQWAVSFMSELLAVAKYAGQPNVTPEQWQWQADEVYSTFTRNALGIPVPEDDE